MTTAPQFQPLHKIQFVDMKTVKNFMFSENHVFYYLL